MTDFVQGNILYEFTEIESDKKSDRPQLTGAIAMCGQHKAKLIIAKLGRLARNVHFIYGLTESSLDSIAVNMPEANHLTIHILAAVAEHERKMSSQRAKAALATAKVKGVRLGNPTPLPASLKVRTIHSTNTEKFRETVKLRILELQGKGYSYNAITKELHFRHIPSTNGRQWYYKTVSNLLKDASPKVE